jgi:signal transduction histidine kinase
MTIEASLAGSGQRVEILLVEDNHHDAELARREILKVVPNCTFRRVQTREAFLAALAESCPDVIVSDFSMPQFDGLSALKLALEHVPQTPLIVFTGSINEDTAVACMKAGASNYVIKEQIKRLGQSVVHALDEGRIRRERRQAELALRQSEERYRKLYEEARRAEETLKEQSFHMGLGMRAARMGLWRADLRSGRFTVLQEGGPISSLCSRNGADTLERFLAMVHPEDRDYVAGRISLATEKGEDYQTEFRILMHDSTIRWVAAFGHCVSGADGRPQVMTGVDLDMTEPRRLEEQFRQAQKMEAIGQLAGGVAHDFNNLLTVILGNASMLLSSNGSPAEQTGCVKQVVEAAERAAGLTRQLLLFGRKQVMQPASLNLNEVVSNMAKMLRRILGEDIALCPSFASGLPAVRGDVGMLEQVLLNLVVNARDAMPRGGRLDITTRRVVVDEESARHNPQRSPGASVCLSVSDTGCGIEPEHLPRIFEPFFTTKEAGKGTGLGLATVYGIVQQHRGWIEVSSHLNQGTVFNIYLPAVEGTAASPRPASAAAPLPLGREGVLVVEDDAAVRLLATQLLQRCGYSVWNAVSGLVALDVWREHAEEIQVLLTDMIMPDGITGKDLSERLLKEKPTLKVIYTSGYSPESVCAGLSLREGENFLKKPYTAAQLVQLVRKTLDAKG